MDLREEMAQGLRGRTAVVGIGNTDRGDDGFGVRLAEELSKAGYPDVIVAGTAPENWAATLADRCFRHVLMLDAVETGSQAGSAVFLDAGQIKNRYPQVSTHRFALGTLARLIESGGSARVWLLGVQPGTTELGAELSESVRVTMGILKELLMNVLPGFTRPAESECPCT